VLRGNHPKAIFDHGADAGRHLLGLVRDVQLNTVRASIQSGLRPSRQLKPPCPVPRRAQFAVWGKHAVLERECPASTRAYA